MSDSEKDQVVMPVWSSPLGQGPHPMERAEMMIIECEADRDELARITPSMCEPADTGIVKVFFANNVQPPNSLRFSEVGIFQEVLYKNERMLTIPYLWVSDDAALLGGRDLFGMSKMMMDDQPLRIHANQIFGRVARDDVTMMEGSMVLERAARPDERPYEGLPSVFERHVPNPNPDKPSLRQLIRLQVTDREVVNTLWFGRGHVEVHHPLISRIDLLRLKSTDRAWYGVFRWNLPFGEIVEEKQV